MPGAVRANHTAIVQALARRRVLWEIRIPAQPSESDDGQRTERS